MERSDHGVSLAVDGPVARLRFRSGHRANVLTLPMVRELRRALVSLEGAAGVRVLVLEGGESIFCGGADLATLSTMSASEYNEYIETEYEAFRRLELLPLITIAAINGACVGNGAEFALSCDFRVATRRSKIGWPEVAVGMDPSAIRLARFLPLSVAKELALTGELIAAERALDLHLFTSVVADDALEEAVDRLASQFAARAPIALRMIKANLDRAYGYANDPSITEAELATGRELFATADFREGAAAVLEKRAAVFDGR